MHDKTRPNALLKTWLSVQFREVIATRMLKLCVICFNLAQPLLLPRAIALASTPETEKYNDIGYGLIGAYALVHVGIAVSLLSGSSKFLHHLINNQDFHWPIHLARTQLSRRHERVYNIFNLQKNTASGNIGHFSSGSPYVSHH